MQRLDLELFVVPDEGLLHVEGVALVRLEAPKSQGPSFQIKALTRDGLVMEARGVEAEVVDGAPRGRLVQKLSFDEAFVKGDELEVHFSYDTTEQLGQLRVAKDVAFASWVEYWYPSPVPTDRSNSRSNHAPGTTTLYLPADWKGVTNGRFVDRSVDDQEHVERWECDQAVARSFAAGPYSEAWYEQSGRTVGVFLLSEKPMGAEAQAGILSHALQAMEERFGPYPYPTYVIAEIPHMIGDFGASSEQGFIMCKPGFFEVEDGNLPLFAHEAAHGWWGNLVAQEGVGSILCSESLAQYGAVLAIESLEGKEAATEFLRFSREGYIAAQCARGYFEMARRGHDLALSELTGGGWQHNLSDAKGHWVFHMIRGRLGDEAFFATLRGVLNKYAGRAMTLNQLREAFEAADDDRDGMRRFLGQWLDRAGAPVIEVELERREGGGATELVIRQVQKGEVYELELEVDLLRSDGQGITEVVSVSGREIRLPLDAKFTWSEAVADPRHRLLIWHPDYGAKPERE